MRIDEWVKCIQFPCADVNHSGYIVPNPRVDPEKITAVMIAEAAPSKRDDDYYAPGDPLFQQTTVLAFNDAGAVVCSVQEILDLGVYLTTAVKCGETGYAIRPDTVEACSHLLEAELALFPNVKAFLLMGDVAIRALNLIAKRAGEPRVIPAGSTYKIRGQEYFFRGKHAFPSYLQAGPSFFIEKAKRKMIAEDIAGVLRLLR